jgi:delta 1-pyrroline-5-carboxylate dehydrogenase
VYAPVGSHEDLLPYLVRRLLENGANTSFVNRIVDESVAVEDIVADPLEESRSRDFAPHPAIVPPARLFGEDRLNSAGMNLPDAAVSAPLLAAMQRAAESGFEAYPRAWRSHHATQLIRRKSSGPAGWRNLNTSIVRWNLLRPAIEHGTVRRQWSERPC